MKFDHTHLHWIATLASVAVLGAACGNETSPPPGNNEDRSILVRAIHMSPSMNDVDIYGGDASGDTIPVDNGLALGQFTGAYRSITIASDVVGTRSLHQRGGDEYVTTNTSSPEAPVDSLLAYEAGANPSDSGVEPILRIEAEDLEEFAGTAEGPPSAVAVVFYDASDENGDPKVAWTVIRVDDAQVPIDEIRLAGLHVARGLENLSIDMTADPEAPSDEDTPVFENLRNVANGGAKELAPLNTALTDATLRLNDGASSYACDPMTIADGGDYTVFAVKHDDGVNLHVVPSAPEVDVRTSDTVSCTLSVPLDGDLDGDEAFSR